MTMPHISIAAPAFNEGESIAGVLTGWADALDRTGEAWEIVIANDGSTDGTAAALAELQRDMPNLVVVAEEQNHGYGYALNRAIAATRGELVMTLDSDGQFDAAEYPRLAAELAKGYDMVTGWRRKKNDSPLRVVADRGLNLLVRTVFGLRLRDTNCAQKLLRGDLARRLRIEARGFPTPTELCVRAQTLGYRVGELDVPHYERAGGESKLRVVRTAWQMLLFLVYLKYRQCLYRWRIINEF